MKSISNIDVYIVSFAIYITCTILFAFLLIYAHRKYQDKNFLNGIFISGLFYFLPLLALPSLYFIMGYVLSLIFGFIAGYFNSYIKRGILSGAAGIFLSWLLFSALSPLGFLIFYSFSYIGYVVIPTTLCGAIGGTIGCKIRQRSETNLPLKTSIVESNNNDSKTTL